MGPVIFGPINPSESRGVSSFPAATESGVAVLIGAVSLVVAELLAVVAVLSLAVVSLAAFVWQPCPAQSADSNKIDRGSFIIRRKLRTQAGNSVRMPVKNEDYFF